MGNVALTFSTMTGVAKLGVGYRVSWSWLISVLTVYMVTQKKYGKGF